MLRDIFALRRIKSVLSKSKTVLIASHIDPDADTIGSMLALYLALKRMRIKATMYSEDRVPATYRFLPNAADIENSIDLGKTYDTVITVDAADIKRAGHIDLRLQAKTLINIDHHPDNTKYGDINFVSLVSSSAELVYKLFKFLNVRITKEIATCLYTAMITDTGNFRYENTSSSTFEIAADLVRSGISPNLISSKIYESRSVSSLRVLALALDRMQATPNCEIVWSAVTRAMLESTNAHGEELTDIVDHLRMIKGAKVAVLFREAKDGLTKVNLRSKDNTNVQKIAAELGGGGHKRAAGISLSKDIDAAQKLVISTVKKHLGL
jgi:phosphoesterase RecJ-like protein